MQNDSMLYLVAPFTTEIRQDMVKALIPATRQGIYVVLLDPFLTCPTYMVNAHYDSYVAPCLVSDNFSELWHVICSDFWARKRSGIGL